MSSPAILPASEAEASEAEMLLSFETGAPAEVRSALGIAAARIGGGVALAMRHDPMDHWSVALGLGFAEPVTADLVDEIGAFYSAQHVGRARFQLAPEALPGDWPEICEKTGLAAGGTSVKLVCRTEIALARITEHRPATDLRVAPVSPQDATAWGSAQVRGFGEPEGDLVALSASVVGREGWHAFGTWDGDGLVGTGALHVRAGVAQFFGGATLPRARKRGGQTALLAARAELAASLGCTWLVAETGAEDPGTHNPSLHNMLRLGFEVRYERRDWIWQA
ncbi:hypothetical protein [Amycolatopsis sacchari]|uniref:hypothetical protein n=1 Tax=Amycolatopsis sacchari TaxID=115433 RepID=UPI003EB85379